MAKEEKLFAVLRKIVFCSQAFGTYPYNELLQKENRHGITIVYQLILLVSNVIIAFSVTRVQFGDNFKTAMFSLFVGCTRLVISAVPALNFATIFIKRHLMKEIFESLLEVNSHLEMLGYQPRYVLERKTTYFSSFFTILSVICFALGIYHDFGSYLDIFHMAVGLTTTSATIQLIVDLVSIAGQQFHQINTYLSKSSSQSRIDFFIRLHNRVSLECYIINKLFSKQILVISFAVFFHTTITIHSFVDGYVSIHQLYSNKILSMRVFMTCTHLILGYSLVNTCVWTGMQSKDFTQILHSMMVEDETERLCHNRMLGLHFAMKLEVDFTACGFFNVDFSLIHSMVSAATTYLALLVQLGQEDDESK